MRPVKKSIKIAALTLLSVLIAGAAGISLIVYLYPRERVLAILTERAEHSLKRKLTIGGIDYSIRGINLNKLIIYDGLTEKDEVLARADNGRISMSLNSLLRREFDLNYISVEKLRLNISYKNGISNLERFIRDIASPDKTSFTTKLAYINLSNAVISLQNAPAHLKPLEGDYTINGTLDITDTKKIIISDFSIRLPENRGQISSENLLLSIPGNGKFSIKTNAALDNCSLIWVYGWKSGAPLPFRSFDGTVHNLVITAEEITGQARGYSSLSNSGTLHTEGFCRIHIPTLHTHIFNASGKTGQSSAFLKTLSITRQGEITDIAINTINIDLRDIRGLIPFLPDSIYGRVIGDVSYEKQIINASIKLSGGSLGNETKILSGIDGDFRITNNTFHREAIPVTILDTLFRVSIATVGKKFDRFVINAEAKEMTISRNDKGDSSLNLSNITIPASVSGRININKLKIDNYTFNQAGVVYATSRKQITINRAGGKFMGGDLEGKGVIDFSRNSVDIDMGFTFNRVRVQNIAELNEKFKNRVFGTAEGKAEVSLRIQNGTDTAKSTKGRLEFTINNGKLVDTGIQNGLGIWLQELRFKLKDLEFNRIYGNFNIVGNNYYVNLFQFDAPDIRMKIDGYFDRDLDGDMKMNLEFKKSFIQDLPNPALIRLSQFKQGNWYSIPFKIKGNITQSRNITRIQ